MMIALMFLGLAAGLPQSPCLAVPDSAGASVPAASQTWYIDNSKISFAKKPYSKYGLPRGLIPGDVLYGGSYKGTPIGVDPTTKDHEVVYVLVDVAKCMFQPYQRD